MTHSNVSTYSFHPHNKVLYISLSFHQCYLYILLTTPVCQLLHRNSISVMKNKDRFQTGIWGWVWGHRLEAARRTEEQGDQLIFSVNITIIYRVLCLFYVPILSICTNTLLTARFWGKKRRGGREGSTQFSTIYHTKIISLKTCIFNKDIQ